MTSSIRIFHKHHIKKWFPEIMETTFFTFRMFHFVMSPYEIRTIFLYLISIRDSLSENKKNYNCKYELKYFAKSVVLNKKNRIP